MRKNCIVSRNSVRTCTRARVCMHVCARIHTQILMKHSNHCTARQNIINNIIFDNLFCITIDSEKKLLITCMCFSNN
jgi:hypothetical protein